MRRILIIFWVTTFCTSLITACIISYNFGIKTRNNFSEIAIEGVLVDFDKRLISIGTNVTVTDFAASMRKLSNENWARCSQFGIVSKKQAAIHSFINDGIILSLKHDTSGASGIDLVVESAKTNYKNAFGFDLSRTTVVEIIDESRRVSDKINR